MIQLAKVATEMTARLPQLFRRLVVLAVAAA